MNDSQVTQQVRDHLKAQNEVKNLVEIKSYQSISAYLEQLASVESRKIWLPKTVSYGLASIVPEKQRHIGLSPVTLMKAIKNSTEIDGFINAHIKDAAALCSYFAWLEKNAGKPGIDEMTGAKELERLR